MLVRFKTGRVHWAFMTATMLALIAFGCRERAQPGDGNIGTEAAGEPEQYSATVVRTIEVGATRETNISREARAGQQRWEEWTENGRNLALIWSTDIGRAFLLDLDRRVYVEIDMSGATLAGSLAAEPRDGSGAQGSTDLNASDSTVQTIDRYFVETQSPTNIETQTLSSVVIDGHPCVVYQQRATFPDGHTETTKRFHARDLSGLLLRVESEGEQGSSKITTERRDVRIEAAPERFIVPADFKRVASLPR